MNIISDMSRDELEKKFKELIYLILECRDALPAITMTAAKLHGVDLSLADRIEACLKPFETTKDNPNGI